MLARSALLAMLALALPAWAADRIEMFYLGAPDCRYCQHWESRARGELLASPEARGLRYVEVMGETLREPIVERHYPAEYRWVFAQIGPTRGVPRFLLAVNGRVTVSAYGTGGYHDVFLPALRAAVAQRAAGSARAGPTRGDADERFDAS